MGALKYKLVNWIKRNKQKQETGDGSIALQADHITVNNGIDEKRTREIFKEMLPVALNDFAKESYEIAKQRVNAFESTLFKYFDDVSKLEVLKDPEIQLILIESQKVAMSTDNPTDYDLLTKLLIERFNAGNDKYKISSTSQAIEAVTRVSDEALQGLTIIYTILFYFPKTGDINSKFEMIEKTYSTILYSSLPEGEKWVDNLMYSSSLRVANGWGMEKFEKLFMQQLNLLGLEYNINFIDEKLNQYPNISQIRHWWNSFIESNVVRITSVGKELVEANLKRFDISTNT